METLGKDGRYELRAPIGQGTLAATFEAFDARRRVPVIIERFAASADLTAYAEVVAALKRADVAGVAAPQELVLTRDPAPFAVHAATPGESLESALREGALQWARAAAIVAGCANVLAAVARATGHTHRALVPADIWLTADGAPRVLGFGRAALGPGEPVRRGRLSCEYRAPEQLVDSPGDARSDVFTLAVLLVELTTGVHPFSGTTAFQAAHKLTRTPPDLAELTRGMPATIARDVAALVRRALAGDPDERPRDAAALAERLEYYRPLAGAPAPHRPAPPVASPTPVEPPRHVEDPTTVLQLPNMRHLFPRRPAADPPPPAASEPSAAPEPAPSPPAAPAPPRPHTPVPQARLAPPPEAPDLATLELPVHKDPPPPATATPRPALSSPVRKDTFTPGPPPATATPRPALPSPVRKDTFTPGSPASDLSDITERDIRPADEAATVAHVRLPRFDPSALNSDDLATIAVPRGLHFALRAPAETTLLLPEARPAADGLPAGARPGPLVSARVKLLIGLNVLCVLVLLVLVIAVL
ncbi:MAG: protein kinase [Myxococcales bacterium]|nr:protein kinase [Myxococcales bacterium]